MRKHRNSNPLANPAFGAPQHERNGVESTIPALDPARRHEFMLREIASLVGGDGERWQEAVELVRAMDTQLDLVCAALEEQRQASERVATRMAGLADRLRGGDDTDRLAWLADNSTGARDRYDGTRNVAVWFAVPGDGLTPLARIRASIDRLRKKH